MRAVDLFGVPVYDASGTRVGKVRDLYVEAGGPTLRDSGDPTYRLVALECGSLGLAHRLGYGRREMAGPWPLDRILARLARRSRVIAWGQIATITADRVDLSIELGTPGHIREAGA